MKGIFGNMFDLNHDGNISLLESTMEFIFLNELLKDDSEERTELELSGLDPDELEFMDPDERREGFVFKRKRNAVFTGYQKCLLMLGQIFVQCVTDFGETVHI